MTRSWNDELYICLVLGFISMGRIAVVDDNEDTRDLLSFVLTDGHSIDTYNAAEDFIEH